MDENPPKAPALITPADHRQVGIVRCEGSLGVGQELQLLQVARPYPCT